MTFWFYAALAAGLLSVAYGFIQRNSIMAASPGNARMQEIAQAIREGADAYLSRQYRTIAYVGVVVLVILFLAFQSWEVPLGFVIGAVLSGIAGFIGMKVSVQANVRTTEASRNSLQAGLDVAFKSGAVTGLLVVGLALIGIVAYYGLLIAGAGYAPMTATSSMAWWRSVSAHRSFRFLPVSAVESSPRAPTLVATWSARSKRESPRMIRGMPPQSQTMSVTMLATVQAWLRTCLKPMR